MVKKVNDQAILEKTKEIDDFISNLKDIEDYRINKGKRHSLAEIFLLILCGQINGFESLREYVMYGKMKLSFLRIFLPYKHGIPSKSTICRILSLFTPKSLENLLPIWVKDISNTEEQGHIAIDGKRHRGLKAIDEQLHLVGAYAVENGLLVSQEKVADKSNEITAIPKILDNLEIKGQIISIDAMGCQKEIATKIKLKQADYVLSLKGNHSTLHENVSLYFHDQNNLKDCNFYEYNDKGHGRLEIRRCYITSKIDWAYKKHEWSGLKSIAMVESTRIIKDISSTEKNYFISSLPPDPKKMLTAVRAHWGIENSLHWVMDVIFHEDKRIIWNRNFAHNESIIKRFALNLLKKFQNNFKLAGKKIHVAIKTLRKILLINDNDMENLISMAN